jgi:hypothetical protein
VIKMGTCLRLKISVENPSPDSLSLVCLPASRKVSWRYCRCNVYSCSTVGISAAAPFVVVGGVALGLGFGAEGIVAGSTAAAMMSAEAAVAVAA